MRHARAIKLDWALVRRRIPHPAPVLSPSPLRLRLRLLPLLFTSPPFSTRDDYDPSRLVQTSALDQHFHQSPRIPSCATLSPVHAT